MSKVVNSLKSWKNSLIDISKRNRAIQFKNLKLSTIDIVYPDISEFLNTIENENLKFINIFGKKDIEKTKLEKKDYIFSYGLSILKKEEYLDSEIRLLTENYKAKNPTKKNIVFSSSNYDLQKTKLRSISQQARLFEEENAFNVLYIAVGLIKWYEDDNKDNAINSPLFFLPSNIKQKSIEDLYELSLRENDITINEALVRYMKDNFGYNFSYTFNEEESILENYNNYKNYLNNLIKSSKNWEILDKVNLSTFKFNNINMVKDLEENQDKILNHNLIQSLAGETTSNTNTYIKTEREVCELKDPDNFYQALDSDSSQSIAIDAAINGKSFVLQGPPGTGKSQTITNIITELIARDKKVLFVAEKKAALDVVYNNLKSIGLSKYAISLHNVQLDKKKTIDDLANALKERQSQYEKLNVYSKEQLKENYISSKKYLNKYGESLLKNREPLNTNLYKLYGEYFSLEKYPEIRFDIKDITNINSDQLKQRLLEINELEKIINVFEEDIKDNAWYNFKLKKVTYNEKEEIDELLYLLNNKLNEYKNLLTNFSNILNISLSNFNLNNIFDFNKLIYNSLKLTNNDIFKNIYSNNFDTFYNDYSNIKKAFDISENLKKHEKEIKNYNLEIMKEDINSLLRVVFKRDDSFSRMFSKDYREVKKTIKPYQIKKNLKYNDLLNDLKNLKVYKDNLINFNYVKKQISKDFNLEINLKNIKEIYEKYTNNNEFIKIYKQIFDNNNYYELLTKINDNNSLLIINEEVSKLNEKSTENIGKINNYIDNFSNNKNDSIEDFLLTTKELISNKRYIDTMSRFNYLKDKFEEKNLEVFLNNIIEDNYRKDIENIYLRRHIYILINTYIEEDKVLNDFNKNTYNRFRSNYSKLDKTLIETTKIKVEEILNKKAPNLNGPEGSNPEIVTLLRESEKQRRIMPVRKLIDEIPNLILKLKPLFMMSPLSVSTFLRTSDYKFDVVIFDEASQVHPENAIGALYRSNQFIIVGDSKQLPPTNFFKTLNNDEEETDASDFESILDIANAALPSISLKWHYRSKFEELIFPSNNEMYNNMLTTFPQPLKTNKREGLEFEKVDGVYFNRRNEIEALKIIDLIYEHFDTYGYTRSLGIVTLNQAQRDYIDDLLLKERRNRPEYENYFSYDNKNEPFFIKNIENVQGDERDTIIISVTYAPDKNENFSMRFGPINQDGGNRRLNVAITRAKYNLIIVSSITHDQIDLNRSSKEGVEFFKNILKFAELGINIKNEIKDDNIIVSSFEQEVYNELTKLGYKVVSKVGTSDYKIDLAIIDPNDENKFILGIECDGVSYKNSKTTRERDRLKQEVLNNRGWNIYRIWSTDWFKNKQVELEKLKEIIDNIVKKKTINKTAEEPIIYIKKDIINKKEEIIFDTYPNYKQLKFNVESMYNNRIDALEYIFEETTPIHINEIKKNIPFLYNREKYTKVVEELFYSDLKNTKLSTDYFIRNDFVLSKKLVRFRKVEDFNLSRDFVNIHPLELKDGILTIIEKAELISVKELKNLLREYCGYQSMSINIKEYIKKVLNVLIENKLISKNDKDILKLNNYNKEGIE